MFSGCKSFYGRKVFWRLCTHKLPVLCGARLLKPALLYSRAAEPTYLEMRFPGPGVHAVPAATLRAVCTLSAGPMRSKGWVQDLRVAGADRCARSVGADWFLRPLMAVTVISAGPAGPPNSPAPSLRSSLLS